MSAIAGLRLRGLTRRSIGIVVGNGLTIDYMRSDPILSNGLNPSTPLSWPDDRYGYHPLRAPAFREFAAAVENARIALPDATDFDLFVAAVREDDAKYAVVHEEAKRYLAWAFTHFNNVYCQDDYLRTWRWYHWIRQFGASLRFVISFNYDLIFESALSLAGAAVAHTAVPQEFGLPLFKPHSSIDLGQAGVGGLLGNVWVLGSDFPQRRLHSREMVAHRPECNLVLPGRASDLRDLRAMRFGREKFAQVSLLLTDFIIAGISYWSVDRVEIDELLDGLDATRCTVHVVNPHPPLDLLVDLRMRGLRYKTWTFPPLLFG